MDNYKLLVKPGPGEWIPDPNTWGGNLAKSSGEENEKMLFDISADPEERWISCGVLNALFPLFDSFLKFHSRENLAPFLPDLVNQLEARSSHFLNHISYSKS